MTATTTLTSPSPSGTARLAPLPDPPKAPDALQQLPYITRAYLILDSYFHRRPDVFVGGNGYLCFDTRNCSRWVRPDCLVAFGVDPEAILACNGYVISEVGKPPEFVLEVASESTGRRDYTHKRAIYAEYGVAEYWRFDRSGGQYHDRPLSGDCLVNGQYEPLPLDRRGRGNPRLQPGARVGATLGRRPTAVLRPDSRRLPPRLGRRLSPARCRRGPRRCGGGGADGR